MCSSNRPAGSVTYFNYNYRLTLILVQQGESREAAWARHLTIYPEALRASIRIFHYSAQDSPSKTGVNLNAVQVNALDGRGLPAQ
ncbi:MAG: hypothetical protein PHW74_06705 [Desulfobacca sp.]|nr:hypothetical protein [Desulfobacca sp.]